MSIIFLAKIPGERSVKNHGKIKSIRWGNKKIETHFEIRCSATQYAPQCLVVFLFRRGCSNLFCFLFCAIEIRDLQMVIKN